MLPRSRSRASLSGCDGSGSAPKTAARGPTVATALAQFHGVRVKRHTWEVADKLIRTYGLLRPTDLGPTHVSFINAWLARYENSFSKHRRAGAAKRVFRFLFEEFGALPLHNRIIKVTKPKPRNVTATQDERKQILAAAPAHLRCWLMMCSDLAIRSGTAAGLGPSHYDRSGGVLTFRTKYQNAQQIPVTAELRELFEQCLDPALPFVAQLTRGRNWTRKERPLAPLMRVTSYHMLISGFNRLKVSLGISRKLTPHDLRRTTARTVYSITQDLRTVQALLGHSDLNSTMWYLQDNLINVDLSTLELAKINPTTEKIQ